MCVAMGVGGWLGGISTFFYQQKGLLLDSVRFSCPILLLLVRVKQKLVFTLWLMSKGHGAEVGATYGLLARAKKISERGAKMERKRARLTQTECSDCRVLPRLFSQP